MSILTLVIQLSDTFYFYSRWFLHGEWARSLSGPTRTLRLGTSALSGKGPFIYRWRCLKVPSGMDNKVVRVPGQEKLVFAQDPLVGTNRLRNLGIMVVNLICGSDDQIGAFWQEHLFIILWLQWEEFLPRWNVPVGTIVNVFHHSESFVVYQEVVKSRSSLQRKTRVSWEAIVIPNTACKTNERSENGLRI